MPPEFANTTLMKITSLDALDQWTQKLAPCLKAGDTLLLHGDLGAGKSDFCRSVIRALTTIDQEVPSPTFTLVQSYEGSSGPIHHYDLYRIEDPEELFELNIEESFTDAITLIEWPDRLGHMMPRDPLRITITFEGEDRHFDLSGSDRWKERLHDLV